MTFVNIGKAAKALGVHQNTLRRWADEGKIETIRSSGGHRRFNVDRYIRDRQLPGDAPPAASDRRRICYCRVSAAKQRADLRRQIDFMRQHYPQHEIISDVGSGLSFKRKGFKAILDAAYSGDIEELVVAYKDRLCRFGFDMVQYLVEEKNDGRLLVLGNRDVSPQQELVEDLTSIIYSFGGRLHGLRDYRKEINDRFGEGSAVPGGAMPKPRRVGKAMSGAQAPVLKREDLHGPPEERQEQGSALHEPDEDGWSVRNARAQGEEA
jgi:excisionase family DNA binding protein